MAKRLIESNFAVVAMENMKGNHGCWETADVDIVSAALRSWRKQHKAVKSVPLFLLGPSSGGFFATQFARHVRDTRALSIQVSVPARDDVRAPLPSGADHFPPLQLILMQKDSAKLKEAEALVHSGEDWAGRASAELLVSHPRPVDPTFFAEGIPGLARDASAAVRAELVRLGKVDQKNSKVLSHPRREEWREAVQRGLLDEHGKPRRNDLPQRSLSVAMDAIFARLDLAYAYHASTCEHIESTIAFFRRSVT